MSGPGSGPGAVPEVGVLEAFQIVVRVSRLSHPGGQKACSPVKSSKWELCVD